jgi:Recombination endonuclease VII
MRPITRSWSARACVACSIALSANSDPGGPSSNASSVHPLTKGANVMNEERRRRKNARRRERYRDDADYREKLKASQRARYANDEEFREKQKAEQRERWANDDDYREKQKAMRRNRYANDGEFRARFKAGVRASRLKHHYGLSIDEYRQLLERQNHACGICERPFVSTPHVDHCHITNWVRGLLCRRVQSRHRPLRRQPGLSLQSRALHAALAAAPLASFQQGGKQHDHH